MRHDPTMELECRRASDSSMLRRAVLAVLGGGCHVPIGAHGTIVDGALHLRAMVISPDGSRVVKSEAYGIDPVNIGASLGKELLEKGAADILG